MILSICIPTVSHRKGLLSRLLWSIGEQAQGFENMFEVLVYPGDDIPYGDKLNHMFSIAQGEWVVAVGDDDWLPANYLQILPLLRDKDVDYLGYKILYLEGGHFQYEIAHSAEIKGWPTRNVRGVCQTCPVRTSIAKSVPFGNKYTDDQIWSMSVREQVKTYLFVDRVLYYYDHRELTEMVGTTRDQRPDAWIDINRVGEWDYTFPWWEGPVWLNAKGRRPRSKSETRRLAVQRGPR